MVVVIVIVVLLSLYSLSLAGHLSAENVHLLLHFNSAMYRRTDGACQRRNRRFIANWGSSGEVIVTSPGKHIQLMDVWELGEDMIGGLISGNNNNGADRRGFDLFSASCRRTSRPPTSKVPKMTLFLGLKPLKQKHFKR